MAYIFYGSVCLLTPLPSNNHHSGLFRTEENFYFVVCSFAFLDSTSFWNPTIFVFQPDLFHYCYHKHPKEVSSNFLGSWGSKTLMNRPYSHFPCSLFNIYDHFCQAAEELFSWSQIWEERRELLKCLLILPFPPSSLKLSENQDH